MSPQGKVGAFGFDHADGAKLKSGRWQRVAITVGDGQMATYIDGEECFSDMLPTEKDGRFTIDTQGVQIFGAAKAQNMPGGIHIRYTSLRYLMFLIL